MVAVTCSVLACASGLIVEHVHVLHSNKIPTIVIQLLSKALDEDIIRFFGDFVSAESCTISLLIYKNKWTKELDPSYRQQKACP